MPDKPNVGGFPKETEPKHTENLDAHKKIKEFNARWAPMIEKLRGNEAVDPSHIDQYHSERSELNVPMGGKTPPKVSENTRNRAASKFQTAKQKAPGVIDYKQMNAPKNEEAGAPTLNYQDMKTAKPPAQRTFKYGRTGEVQEIKHDSAPEKKNKLQQSLGKSRTLLKSYKENGSWSEGSLDKSKKKDKPFHGYNKDRHAKTGGLNDKARKKMNREEGSNLKRPVTEKNPKGKKAARKKSFCARMSGVKGPTSKEGKLTPKGAALKRWRCNKSKNNESGKVED